MTKKNVIRLFAVMLVIAIACVSVCAAQKTKTTSAQNNTHGIKGIATLQIYKGDNNAFVATTNASLSATTTSSTPTYNRYLATIKLLKPYAEGQIGDPFSGEIGNGGSFRCGKSATEMLPLEIGSVTALYELKAIATINGNNTMINLGITPSLTCDVSECN